jgi:dienelactone hydrolase
MRRTGQVLATALVLVAQLTWTGCSSPGAGVVVIDVDAPDALIDQPVRIDVHGLQPHQSITLMAETRDGTPGLWRSWAQFQADADGRVDVTRAAPSAGTYTGRNGMGLFLSPQPDGNTAQPVPPGPVEHVTLSVKSGGKVVARRTLVRRMRGQDVLTRHLLPDQSGFAGDFYTAPAGAAVRPGILIFGGSKGGLAPSVTTVAALLASHGYPTLALSYFNSPGLTPVSLSSIPLEYFAAALRWLRAQSGVDGQHVLAYGVSRGSEAALLLGVYFPDLVQGVIAPVPSSVVNCSFPGCQGPAWTLQGNPVPFTRQSGTMHPTDEPAAEIPVEQIEGPLFMDCGDADRVWPSCGYGEAIVARLVAHHGSYRHTLLQYPAAGHGVGDLVPYMPEAPVADLAGALPGANERAREQAWPSLLGFLQQVQSSS